MDFDMVRAMYGIKFMYVKHVENFMQMLGLNEGVDKIVMTNSMH